MNNLDLYSSLTLDGKKIHREIITAYLENFFLGVNEEESQTIVYFKNVNKNEVNNIILKNFELDNWHWEDIEDQDWMINWKPFFRDILIDDKVIVIPKWSNRIDNDKIVLKINPGMAFGTGHHETTELMIRFILKYHKKNMDVLDLGTGSGILSILACKLYSNKILSVDNDHIIKDNFNENMLINDTKAILKIDDCLKIKDFNYDLILVNINKSILINLMPMMICKKGFIVLSGIIESDYDEISDLITKNGFNIVEFNKINEWIGIVIK